MDGLVAELVEGARGEMAVVEEQGGAVEAVPYMKARLVESTASASRASSAVRSGSWARTRSPNRRTHR